MKKLSLIFIVVLLLGGCSASKNEHSETQLMLDTVCTIRAGGENAESAVCAAFAKIAEIEALTDYYSETSEVSAINHAEVGESIPLSEDVAKILTAAMEVSRKSDGAFDITIAPVKDLWKFSDSSHEPPSQDEISAAMQQVGYRNLLVDTTGKTLTKTADCKIDLGGAAKGYAADCAAEVLKQHNCEYAVIDLGGNVYVFGSNPSRRSDEWLIGIQKPFSENGSYSQTVALSEGAVVTAGSYQRYFEWNGKLYHHILDPKCGYPSDSGISGASIKADNALYADCLSTACMVLGEEKGKILADQFNAELITER